MARSRIGFRKLEADVELEGVRDTNADQCGGMACSRIGCGAAAFAFHFVVVGLLAYAASGVTWVKWTLLSESNMNLAVTLSAHTWGIMYTVLSLSGSPTWDLLSTASVAGEVTSALEDLGPQFFPLVGPLTARPPLSQAAYAGYYGLLVGLGLSALAGLLALCYVACCTRSRTLGLAVCVSGAFAPAFVCGCTAVWAATLSLNLKDAGADGLLPLSRPEDAQPGVIAVAAACVAGLVASALACGATRCGCRAAVLEEENTDRSRLMNYGALRLASPPRLCFPRRGGRWVMRLARC